MRLSGQNLRAGMAGDEVAELHAELILLGFAIPDTERRDQVFGVGTAQAVAAFQKAHGLRETAVVDRRVAAALTRTERRQVVADFHIALANAINLIRRLLRVA